MTITNPILISIPHSGTQFPEEVRSNYIEQFIDHPEDTDWFVDQLYSFADELNIEVVMAPYSRYVIDLNRDPQSNSLYSDGRSETSLIPSTTFLGQPLLKNGPDNESEVKRRLNHYYWPYYKNLEEKLEKRVEQFGHALLFDAHSIKREVKSIHSNPFPDMILGTADEKSASNQIIQIALETLQESSYQVTHNFPFKGGHITRYFGKPLKRIHALQLEMSQDIYMDEDTTTFNPQKAEKVQIVLRKLFQNLLKV